MVGVPVDVSHEVPATVRALDLVDGELVVALEVRIRN
jgi:hypothetical protein